jgi:hypothetical protein
MACRRPTIRGVLLDDEPLAVGDAVEVFQNLLHRLAPLANAVDVMTLMSSWGARLWVASDDLSLDTQDAEGRARCKYFPLMYVPSKPDVEGQLLLYVRDTNGCPSVPIQWGYMSSETRFKGVTDVVHLKSRVATYLQNWIDELVVAQHWRDECEVALPAPVKAPELREVAGRWELWYGQKIRDFRRNARVILKIVQTFNAADWPPTIEASRIDKDRLRNNKECDKYLASLNQGLRLIEFHIATSDRGESRLVGWRVVQPAK